MKPKYTTLYGTIAVYGSDTDAERLAFLTQLMEESIEMYNQNKAGYPHH